MNNNCPKISIVTPVYNQVGLIESTITSVLSQNYPNLEYIIIDGGSTDGTVDIIKKYENQLAYWCSEPDKGMYDAIRKGFEKSTGDIMAWISYLFVPVVVLAVCLLLYAVLDRFFPKTLAFVSGGRIERNRPQPQKA